MIEGWQSFIQHWRAQETPSSDPIHVKHYLARIKLRHRLAYLHWVISKVSVVLVYGFGIYSMLTAFSWIGLTFFLCLAAVATLATLASDPKFLGLQKRALDTAEDYIILQNKSLKFKVKSIGFNFVLCIALIGLTIWADHITVPISQVIQIDSTYLRYLILLGLAYEAWRMQKYLKILSNVRQLQQK